MVSQSQKTLERRCIVTRQPLSPERMIRFVCAPDGQVVPDLAEKLPGRGAWVSCRLGNISSAVKKNLFAKAFSQNVRADSELESHVKTLLEKQALGLLGLCRKSGTAVSGFHKVFELSNAHDGLFLLATNASKNAAGKLQGLADGRELFQLFSAEQMGHIFGREQAVNVFIRTGGPYERLKKDLNRLFYLRGECAKTAREKE